MKVKQSCWSSDGETVMVEHPWGTVMLEQEKWNSDGGTVMVGQSWWNSRDGTIIVEQ